MSIYKEILQEYWGYDNFRELQEDIILSVADGNDTLGLMPTGGGKSITFQVYSLSVPGVCIVITPLIALMKDQVESLRKRGIKSLMLHSGMTARELKVASDNAVWGDYKFLYVSPERIQSSRFKEILESLNVNLICVDEAHCISQWGYNFRPSYLHIGKLRTFFPNIPILALTATATPKVATDIQDKLKFNNDKVFKMSFVRNNISYIVRHREDKIQYTVNVTKKVLGSGIVYVRSRKKCKEISEILEQNGVDSTFYHAGLNVDQRNIAQEVWLTGKKRVIVATNAFGMGIDKSDVRFVIHIDAPSSLEEYFQEAGRAGRDGNKSTSVMLFSATDQRKLKQFTEDKYPAKDKIVKCYSSLGNYCQLAVGTGLGQIYGFDIARFSKIFKYQIKMVYNSLNILEQAGYLMLQSDSNVYTKVYFRCFRDELFKLHFSNQITNAVVHYILRMYSGVFNGYVPINDDIMVKDLKITHQKLYDSIKYLRTLRIIDYIPRLRSPALVWLRDREEDTNVVLGKEVFDNRKEDQEQRCQSIIKYATQNNECRSKVLVSYFGEEKSTDCGHCDVCNKKNTQVDKNELRTLIINELSKRPIKIKDVEFEFNSTIAIDIVRDLLDEEALVIKGDEVHLKKRM
ncbi:MAG: ATP-dependent DNA helicase RecQ [Bacteroidales bacterium]